MGDTSVVRMLVGIGAAALFGFAGIQLLEAASAMDISSVSGNSIDEAFYQAYGVLARGLGFFAFGMAALSIGLLIPRAND